MEDKFVILLEKFLRKQAGPEEVKRLEELFGRAESEEALASLYERKWECASPVLDTETDGQMWYYLEKKIASGAADRIPPEYPLWKKALRVAVSILIPIVCACLGYYYSGSKHPASPVPMAIHTQVGQKIDLQLPDGTHIWLNSASSLQYDGTYNQKDRIVYLQGEAYFEVGKDAKKPFIVKAGDLSVEAIGTSFNVKAYPEDNYITATLIEGCVRVSDSHRSELLMPNEKLTFQKSNRSFAGDLLADAGQTVLWRYNQLAFGQERMEDIAMILERMYGVRIHFVPEELKDIRFSGKIRNTNLDRVLQILTFAAPIRYDMKNDSTIIFQNDDSRIREINKQKTGTH
jgi:ferric-dicitrate binding protein FerR (iron transport regulator)